MGGKSRKRRKTRRKRRTKALAVRRPGAFRIGLRIDELELARGHDGLLRGSPEPTLLLAVYRVDATTVTTHGRYLYRFECPASLPAKVAPQESSNESIVVPFSEGARIVVLVLAVEEDSGQGLQALYAELENGDAVVAWLEPGGGDHPMHLPELTTDALVADAPHRIHLVFDDRDPSQQLSGDDWIGAALVWAPLETGRGRHRLHFVSADARNDWTAELELTLRRA